jgi:hypothetical protein
MNAPSVPVPLRQALFIPEIVCASRYEVDSECSTSLLATTCSEQKGRLHTLSLLSEYLASGAGGRKRQLVAKEMQALRELYETVWCELGCAFSDPVVYSVREAVEHEARYRETLTTTAERKRHCGQWTLF